MSVSESDLLLEKAERSLHSAENQLADGDADFAASRAYYGCFYTAQALLLSLDLRFSRHGQVVAQYGYHFAKTGRLDPAFHRLLSRALSFRHTADYEVGAPMDSEAVRELVREGHLFVEAARGYLESLSGEGPGEDSTK